MYDRRISLRDIARQIGISFGAVQSILSNILGKSKVSARWVRRMLTKDQKKSRLDISKYLLSLYEEFMRRVVTKDETWVHHFDPEAKKLSMKWKHSGSPLLRKEFLHQGRKLPLSFGIDRVLTWWIILRKSTQQMVHIMQKN